jgi:hypothetical protein
MRIRTKTRSEKAARTRKRNANPLLAAKRVAERPQPADGIRFKRSKVTGEMLEFCVTPEAKHLRRIEVWEQAKGDCQGCGHGVGDPEDSGYHWHHRKHRSQGGDDSLANAQCLCRRCYALVHGIRDCTNYLKRGEREAAV